MKMERASVTLVAIVMYIFLTAKVQSLHSEHPEMKTPPLFNYGEEMRDSKIVKASEEGKIQLPMNVTFFGAKYDTLYLHGAGAITVKEKINVIDYDRYRTGRRGAGIKDVPGIVAHIETRFDYLWYRVLKVDKMKPSDEHNAANEKLVNYLNDYLPTTVVNPPLNFKVSVVVIVTWNTMCNNATCPASQIVLALDEDTTFLVVNYDRIKTNNSYVIIGDELDTYIYIPCRGECYFKDNSTMEVYNLKSADIKGRFIMNLADPIPISGGCLPDELVEGKLEIFPRTVGMFGGERLQVSGQCKPKDSKLYCRFGEIVTTGLMVNEYKGHCPVPLMYHIGPITVSMSFDNQSWSSSNTLMVVHPENVDLSRTISTEVKKQWYSRDAEEIAIPWNTKLLDNSEVQVKLLSCKESVNSITCKTLKILQNVHVDDGMLKITISKHHCKSDCRDQQIGLFDIASLGENIDGHAERVAIRYGPFPLGWYINKEMEEELGAKWSDDLCREWHALDSKNKGWTNNIPLCPCNIRQALADFGRFQMDTDYNIYTKIKDHHQNVDNQCVISTAGLNGNELTGSRCCYDNEGNLVYSQLSYHGSTSDRSHSQGVVTNTQSGHVPLLSHWNQDITSRFYCCLWNENHLCHKYISLRPTADCQNYTSPGFAFIRGSSHITTFDGQNYLLVSNGFFWLVYIKEEVNIQGEFSSRPDTSEIGQLLDTTSSSSWKPLALVSVAIKVVKHDQMIYINPTPYGLNVQVNRVHFMFLDKTSYRQDFPGFSIVNNAVHNGENNNFTIRLYNGIGINVHGVNGILHLIVSLPKSFQNRTGMGLLGNFDDKADNDFTSRTNKIINAKSDKRQIHDDFVMSWNVSSDDSLFYHLIKYEPLSKHFNFFELKDLPMPKQENTMNQSENTLCGDNDRCKYDLRVTGKWNIASATRVADEAFYLLKLSAKEILSCGLPEIGLLANLSNNNFSVGQSISVLGCDQNMQLVGELKTYNCIKETRDEAREKDRDYGYVRFERKESEEYIIHWVPRPTEVCSDDEVHTSSIGMYIGIAIGVVAVLICIIIAIVLMVKYCSKNKKSSDQHEISDRMNDESSKAMI